MPALRYSVVALILAAAGLAACSALQPPASLAASSASPAAPDPLDANARVPTAQHRSAFPAERVVREPALRDWREAHDNVARIGGWRAYAREAAASQPAALPEPARPHGGHR